METKAVAKPLMMAMAGNPNVGKSELFNAITAGHAWVGNWPGVTVEKKMGRARMGDLEVEIVDLPGIYGLTAYSVDELVARDHIVKEKPDVVIDVINATSLERNLYLTISLLEMGANVVVALNMIDLAEKKGLKIDAQRLSSLLGIPVVPTVAIERRGVEQLRRAVLEAAENPRRNVEIVDYGRDMEEAIAKLSSTLETLGSVEGYEPRWLAIKLLEGDPEVEKIVGEGSVLAEASEMRRRLEDKLGSLEDYIIGKRYEAASRITSLSASLLEAAKAGVTLTDIFDEVLTHKVIGIPAALAVLYLIFRIAFEVSAPLVDLIDVTVNGWLHDATLMLAIPTWISSLLADGIIAGVGAVLVFLPTIYFFFLGLSFLEDVGYMSRLAFLVDRAMHLFKLSGKSVIPLIIGFGCNVPAVMAARAIEDENDRKTTALVSPLASCSARLPVYLVIGGALFGVYAGAAALSMYVIGIVLALLMAVFFRKVMFRGPSSGFIMELPPYLRPRTRSVLFKAWERTEKFLRKAGTIIFSVAVIIWLLSVTGPGGYLGPEALGSPALLEGSWVGALGHAVEPVFAPMNWDWRAAAALVFGFLAKEVVVGTMGVLYGGGGGTLMAKLASAFTPISGFAYMLFVLVYVPCVATIGVIKSELGAKYAAIALVYELVLAYVVALMAMGAGALLGV